MFKTRGKLLETVDRLLEENKRLRLDNEAKDVIIKAMTETQDKVVADLKKAMEENKDLSERVRTLEKSLSELGKQVREQTGADVLLHALRSIVHITTSGKNAMNREAQIKAMSEQERLHKMYDRACQQAQTSGLSGYFSNVFPQQDLSDLRKAFGL